jgi:transposase
VEAIFLVLREGRPWKSLPSSYPPGKMAYWHYQSWVSQGVWAEVEALVSAGELDSSPGAC